MADSGGSQQTVTRNEPPAYVKPYIIGDPNRGITGVLPEAQRLYESDRPQYFPGSTVTPLAPESELAFTGIANRATAGSPLIRGASGYLGDAIGGKYVNQFLGSPADSALFESIRSRIDPAVSGAASLAGRTGSGAHEGVLARELTNAYAPLAAQMYAGERQLQQQAAGMAPALAAQDYIDLVALGGVGQARQAQSQAELSDEVARHDFEQNVEQMKLDNFLRAVYGAPGATQYSSTSGGGPGLGQSILGGALGLGGLGLGVLGMPWGGGGASLGYSLFG